MKGEKKKINNPQPKYLRDLNMRALKTTWQIFICKNILWKEVQAIFRPGRTRPKVVNFCDAIFKSYNWTRSKFPQLSILCLSFYSFIFLTFRTLSTHQKKLGEKPRSKIFSKQFIPITKADIPNSHLKVFVVTEEEDRS